MERCPSIRWVIRAEDRRWHDCCRGRSTPRLAGRDRSAISTSWLTALVRPIRPVKDLLNGTWLGHPLHAAFTDLPIGVLSFSILLDLLDLRTAADVLLIGGVLLMLLSAVSGLADYTDTDGRARTSATVHDQPAYEIRRTDAGGWEGRRRAD